MKIFGVVGWKNSGKTGLVERLVCELTGRGIKVSTMKHAHHAFDVDQPGKDSYRHRAAGAGEVVLSSYKRWVLMHELHSEDEPPMETLLAKMTPCDLVIVEGYKRDDFPKIEANRAETGQPLLARDDPQIRAVATDQHHENLELPAFDLNDTRAIADFVLQETGLAPSARPDPTSQEIAPPPVLKNDCFALPAGVSWMPVDEALAMLRERMSPVCGVENIPLSQASGRVLAVPQMAARANPPAANSAVDGYGFAHASVGSGPQRLALVEGRSAAGAPLAGVVARGQAVRILTGALVPEGVDTVIMQEDVTLEEGAIVFHGGISAGANLRQAGEDVKKGETVLDAGRRLRPPDLALLAALGSERIAVRKRLRIGVLSTGDELVAPDGGNAPASKTYDANRPLLLSLAQGWGGEAIDLGHVGDDRAALRAVLDEAAKSVDVILTSGGASAGDEDHVSALLGAEGTLHAWRIALKPGRPLALGMWRGVPVFGLPGNPVAAFVTAAIFARPALGVMAGMPWQSPASYLVPAAFSKTKKLGRREYLRARLDGAGRVEVYKSEGSGRISGMAWANGLVELGDDDTAISAGDLVRFIPYESLGLPV